MATPVTWILSSALLLGQVACVGLSLRWGNTPAEPLTPESKRNAGHSSNILDADALVPKAIIGKQPPNVLFARDGTYCTVSADKYDRIVPGASAWCIWSQSGRLAVRGQPRLR